MSDSAGSVRPESTPEPGSMQAAVSPRRWVSLAAICTAAGLVWLAFADLGVAVPTIADDFHADLSALAWANNAFSLVAGSLVIAAGKFGDVFGRRRMLLLGIVLFSGFSVVAALAGNVEMLILGRALMGIGAALILPATLALIPPQFSGKTLLTAFGVWQAVAWGGQAVAPAIGGVITDTVGWPWLFWINIPLGLGAYAVIHAFTPESSDASATRKVDWLGLATIGLAVFALLFALTEGPGVGWSSPLVVGPLAAAVVLAVAWVWIERTVSDPLVDLSLCRLRPYDGALTANLVMNLAYAGLTYLLVLWLQNARGYSAVEAGLLMLPATIGIFAFIPIGGRLDAARGGRMPVLLGLLVLGLGLFVFTPMRAGSGLWLLALGLVVVGVGLGMLSTPVSNTAVGDVPETLAGTAAGVFKMSSMVGGALGVAVLTALARAFTVHDSQDAIAQAGLSGDDVTAAQHALVNSASYADAIASLPQPLRDEVTSAVVDAFSYGVAQATVVTGVVSMITVLVVAYVWPRTRKDDAGLRAPARKRRGE
ncbi:MFS transporter [Rhodococcus triatomae]|nr:major facilitator superfamily protein [Rhodococcus triatomae BKS 15-14]